MDKIDMSEGTARFTFTAACGLSIFATGAAMMLRFKGEAIPSAIFLAFAFLACAITLVSYKQYKLAREARWRLELKKSEDELGQILNHARMNMWVEHIPVPLNAEAKAGSDE